MNEITDIKIYPSTRYQGSKRKIIPWIYENIKDLEFDSVLDACGGSASVSYLFKKMGKSVTYNDYLKFNSLIGKAIIENQTITFSKEDLTNLLRHELQTPDFINKFFRGIYYLENENEWLDKIGYGIFNMNHYTGNILEYKKSLAYYALFQACLIKRPFNLFHRKNLYIRTADVERNFGNKVTWEKDFEKTFIEFIDEVNSLVFDSGTACRALNQSIFEIEDTDFDLVYLDPPYFNKEGTNETSNYLRCYHFLEGLSMYNEWEDKIDTQTPNLRMSEQQAINRFDKENIHKSFRFLIEKFSNSTIVISYKKGGTPSIESIVRMLKEYKDVVYTRSQHYKYALNRQNGNAKKNREVLIIGI